MKNLAYLWIVSITVGMLSPSAFADPCTPEKNLAEVQKNIQPSLNAANAMAKFPWEGKEYDSFHDNYNFAIAVQWRTKGGYRFVLNSQNACIREKYKRDGQIDPSKSKEVAPMNCAPQLIAKRVKEAFGACPGVSSEVPGSPSTEADTSFDPNILGESPFKFKDQTANLTPDCLGFKKTKSKYAWEIPGQAYEWNQGDMASYKDSNSYLSMTEYLKFFPESEHAEIIQIAEKVSAEIQALPRK